MFLCLFAFHLFVSMYHVWSRSGSDGLRCFALTLLFCMCDLAQPAGATSVAQFVEHLFRTQNVMVQVLCGSSFFKNDCLGVCCFIALVSWSEYFMIRVKLLHGPPLQFNIKV